MAKCVILSNYWMADYKIRLFKEIHKKYKDVMILYVGETESIREWQIDKDELEFPHEIMNEGQIDNINSIKISLMTLNALKKADPEVLIIGGYNFASYWTGFIWAKLHKRKVILWVASHFEDKKRYFIKELFKKFIVKNCDAANVYGVKSRMYVERLGMNKDRIFIKGNSCDNDFFFKMARKIRLERISHLEGDVKKRNFLYVGRFSPEKNILRMMEAFSMIQQDELQQWGLILVGDGPQRPVLEKYVDSNNIKNVYFAGFQQKKDLSRYYAMSDVLILPSISEPWGLVVNEAMASGLTVLVSRKCGCYPDLIREGVNGFSFDPFDIRELSIHMMGFVRGIYDSNKMGRSAQGIIKDYTVEKAANVIVDTINYVLKREK